MSRRSSSNRGPVRRNDLIQHEENLNEDLQQKVVRFIAEYHLEKIGTPLDETVEERLRLAERTNPFWWIARGWLWVKYQWVLYRSVA